MEGRPVNLKLVPKETVCPFCDIENIIFPSPKLKRKAALLLCIDGLGSVEKYTKTCPQCSQL
jgi:RNA polymerase subunit RPABC4/transcription elongation factor Spt4